MVRRQSLFWNQCGLSAKLSLNRNFALIPRKTSAFSQRNPAGCCFFRKRHKPINASLKGTNPLVTIVFPFQYIFFSDTLDRVLKKLWNAIHIFPNPQSNKIYTALRAQLILKQSRLCGETVLLKTERGQSFYRCLTL